MLTYLLGVLLGLAAAQKTFSVSQLKKHHDFIACWGIVQLHVSAQNDNLNMYARELNLTNAENFFQIVSQLSIYDCEMTASKEAKMKSMEAWQSGSPTINFKVKDYFTKPVIYDYTQFTSDEEVSAKQIADEEWQIKLRKMAPQFFGSHALYQQKYKLTLMIDDQDIIDYPNEIGCTHFTVMLSQIGGEQVANLSDATGISTSNINNKISYKYLTVCMEEFTQIQKDGLYTAFAEGKEQFVMMEGMEHPEEYVKTLMDDINKTRETDPEEKDMKYMKFHEKFAGTYLNTFRRNHERAASPVGGGSVVEPSIISPWIQYLGYMLCLIPFGIIGYYIYVTFTKESLSDELKRKRDEKKAKKKKN